MKTKLYSIVLAVGWQTVRKSHSRLESRWSVLCGKIFGKSVAFSNLEADQVRKEPVSPAKIILEHSQHGSSGCSLTPLTRDHKRDIKSGVFASKDGGMQLCGRKAALPVACNRNWPSGWKSQLPLSPTAESPGTSSEPFSKASCGDFSARQQDPG